MINDEIKGIVERIRAAISPNKIYLFGSFARGDMGKYSDYDFYVVVPNGAGNVLDLRQKAYCSLLGMKRARGADILVADEATFTKRKTESTIEREVTKEGVLLYEC